MPTFREGEKFVDLQAQPQLKGETKRRIGDIKRLFGMDAPGW